MSIAFGIVGAVSFVLLGGTSSSGGLANAVAATPPPGAAEVAVPASAGALSLMTGSAGRQVTSAIQKADEGVPDLTHAEFGAYSLAGSTANFGNLTLVPLDEVRDFARMYQAMGAAASLAAMAPTNVGSDSVIGSVTMPGGAMTCGLASGDGNTLRACYWIDASEFGILALPPSTSVAQASACADAVWSASETG